MRDRVTKAMDTKIKSNNKNITYGVWMAITGVLIGVVCDECPISLPVIIGQLGGLAIVLCGVLLMADWLMAVLWADKGGGKLMWLFWLMMCFICCAFGFGVCAIIQAGKCYDCEKERDQKFREMVALRQFRPKERQNG